MKYNKFENEVINKLLNYDNSNFEILNKQFTNSFIKSKELSSAGFYLNISVESKIEKLPFKGRIIFGDLIYKESNEAIAGFLLYIEKGYITTLEGYTFNRDFQKINLDISNLGYELGSNRKIPDKLL